MEKKTIGSFIATLRKANGMTQKELAEKVNVSDKTVSRWEREGGVPDLALIPVIAEIFGVSCDELLRGERKSPNRGEEITQEEQPAGGKSEKQKHRILAVSLSKYKNRTFIAAGVSGLGMIAAMIGNLVFLRAYAGFYLGMIFYLAGIIFQAIFANYAFLAVDDEEWITEEVGSYRRSVIRLTEWSIGLTAVLFAVTVPLVLLVRDTYMGLSAASWLLYGSSFGGVALVLVCVVCHFVNGKLFQKRGYYPGERAEKKYQHNFKLARKSTLVTVLVLVITSVVHNIVTDGGNAHALSEGILFYDYESFQEYMARPDSRIYYQGEVVVVEEVVPGEGTYYDEHGNVVSEEEARTRELRDSKGNVLCTYIDRNENVCSVRYTEVDGNVFPITVITYDDLQIGRGKLEVFNGIFGFLCCAEILIGLLVYCKKRI